MYVVVSWISDLAIMLCNDNRVSSKSQVSLLKTFLMSKAQRVMLFPSYSKVQEREGLALSLCRI